MSIIPETLQINFPGPILFGAGVFSRLGEQLRLVGGRRPLLVFGRHARSSGLADDAATLLRSAGAEPLAFCDAALNPTDADVYAGVARFRYGDCDSLVAIGGGSRMDVAKAIRVAVANPLPLEELYFDAGGAARVVAPRAPLVCVPTTAGSGSEASRGTIITDTTSGRKRAIIGPGVAPTAALLDPELTYDLPPDLTASTGMDALSHALESLVGTTENPVAEGMARQAALLIGRYLPQALADGRDHEARAGMLLGSAMAALGFPRGLGVVHSLAHALTPAAGLGHGAAIALLLPHGMAFNLSRASRRYADVARALEICPRSDGDAAAAEALIDWTRALLHAAPLPQTLQAAGVAPGQFSELARLALLDHCHRTNPRPCGEAEMLGILREAWE